MVTGNTRFRNSQNPSIVDLILVSDPNMIGPISIKCPFGKSDHCVLEFSVENHHKPPKKIKHRYNFRKMNEEIFENELSDMNLEMMKKKFKSSL